jgi:hypothetical protein
MTPKLRPEVELPRPRSNGAALVAVASLAMFTAVGASAFVVRVRMEQANWDRRVEAAAPILDNTRESTREIPPPVVTMDTYEKVLVKNGMRATVPLRTNVAQAAPRVLDDAPCGNLDDMDADCPAAPTPAAPAVTRPVVEVELVGPTRR